MNVMERADLVAGARPVDPAALRGELRDDLIRDEVLAEIFTASAKAHPRRTALIFASERLSYAEVDARSDAIARGLIRRGIGPGHVVGLWMCRSAELLVAQL